MAEKPKKISELPQIQNISNDDLLLVSDYDNGSCLSRKMTIKQLVQYIVNAVVQSTSVKQQMKQYASAAVSQTVDQTVENKTMKIVEANIDDIYDMLDGIKNNEMLIDSGGSGV